MENEEIKGNKSAERDVDSSSASEGAREGLFNEAMKELGMPDGKPKPSSDDQARQTESGKNKISDQQVPAANFPRENGSAPNDQNLHNRPISGESTKNNNENAKALNDSLKNDSSQLKDTGDKLAKHQIDPSLVKNTADKLDQLTKNPIDPSLLKDNGIKLDQLTKNPIDPSLLKDNGIKLDQLTKNPSDPSLLKDNGIKLDEMAKNPIAPSILKELEEKNGGDQKKIDPSELKNPLDIAKEDDLKGLEKNNIGELLKELSMRNHEYMKPLGKGGDGDHILPTGDRIQRKDGQETLTTPNGDTVTVNADGTFRTTGDVRRINENKDGTHTITYGDGSTVTVGRNGVERVERGNDRVKFHDLRSALKTDAVKQIKPVKPQLIAR